MRLRQFAASILFTFAAISGTQAYGQDDPVGESGSFTLDPARSHSFIRSGEVEMKVTEDLGDEFNTSMYCKFVIRFLGTREGTAFTPYPKEVFEPAWMEALRAGEVYETPYLKVEHVGYGDAVNSDGYVYEHCDKLRVFDIDTSNACIEAFAASLPARRGPREDQVEMTAHVFEGVPVLGFVKIDMKIIRDGSEFDVGLDYETP